MADIRSFAHRDRELGLDRSITRRDFVHGAALLMGGTLAACSRAPSDSAAGQDYDFDVGDAWYGPGGVGEYAPSHGNTPELIRAAHEIRAGHYDRPPADAIDSGEEYDVVIVGGGIAGLSAAHHFKRLRPNGRALVLDNHPIFGGEAKRNDFDVGGVRVSASQGSNDFAIMPATGDPDDYFTSLGMPREFAYAEPEGAAEGLRIPTDNFAFMHWHERFFDVNHHFAGSGVGMVKDVWGDGLGATPWTPDVQRDFLRVRAMDARESAPGEIGPWLDSMTMAEYYRNVARAPEEVTRYVDPILASIIGLGCDATSAWWGLHFRLPGFTVLSETQDFLYQCFPGGNAGIARHFLKNLLPEGIGGGPELENVLFGAVDFDRLDRTDNAIRLRHGATVVRVEHEGAVDAAERVRVTYTKDGQLHQLRARAVVMASGGWVNRHVVRDLPAGHRQAYESFGHSPVLVANVALTNWRFIERLGAPAVIYSGDFGFSCNIRRPMIVGGRSQPLHPDRPIVLTFYVPIFKPGLDAKQQGVVARTELLSTSFAGYERRIRAQMVELFDAGGFDPTTDVAGIILNRWGHAYGNPGPGFMFGRNGGAAPPDVIREPIGRIAIGHSELRGHQNWVGAAGEGRRAVETLLERYP